MRRILAIIVLAVILVLAISVPALAEKPTDPPWNYGQYNCYIVQQTNELAKSDPDDWIHNGYGRCFMAPVMWSLQVGYPPDRDNGGDYVAGLKELYGTSK